MLHRFDSLGKMMKASLFVFVSEVSGLFTYEIGTVHRCFFHLRMNITR